MAKNVKIITYESSTKNISFIAGLDSTPNKTENKHLFFNSENNHFQFRSKKKHLQEYRNHTFIERMIQLFNIRF